MATISVCMIVKNEERVLKRCLDSLSGLYDELIIVDTGSTDATKDIALKYTDKVYDFVWVNDFAKARNFSFSKATCDFIYTADADEILDEENRVRFMHLKAALVEDVDIVQMKYVNQLENGTVYNFDSEYRAKLYKRLRTFTFIDPVHEIVRTDPVVFDSDIEIIHRPEKLHSDRDIAIFEGVISREGKLSDRLIRMYARELLISGKEEQLKRAEVFFADLCENPELDPDLGRLGRIVVAKSCSIKKDPTGLMKCALKDIAMGGCSEICTILGDFYEQQGDMQEAALWYYNACFETHPETCVAYANVIPLNGLVRVFTEMGDLESAAKYREKLLADG